MKQPVRTANYDLFKAIVALILLVILIWLLLRGVPSSNVVASAPETTSTPTSEPQASPTIQPSATSAAVQPSSTPSPTPTQAPTLEPSPTPTQTATPLPAATATVTATPEATPTAAQKPVDCPLALPTRLKTGDTARVIANLNMRSSAGIASPLILTNLAGTQLKIIGGPVCEPYQSRAYLWWQVSLSDGKTGWSAEGSITGKFYFLEPVK